MTDKTVKEDETAVITEQSKETQDTPAGQETAAAEEEPQEERQETERVEQEYEFLREQVKARPTDSGKLLKRIGRLAASGAVFGVACVLVFCLCAPWARKSIEGNDSVEFPADEKVSQTGEEDTGNPEESEVRDGTSEEKTVETPPEIELTVDHYQQILTGMKAVAREAGKSVVSITPEVDEESWFQEETVEDAVASGLIIAETENEVLVLTTSQIIAENSYLNITFGNGASVYGTLRMQDKNTDLAIIVIPKANIPESAGQYYQPAVLGNSYAMNRGDPLIILGSPFGRVNSMAYGIVSSVSEKADLYDGELQILMSDVAGTSDSSAVIYNLAGEAVGIVVPKLTGSPVIQGLAISEIKTVIERMSNSNSIPYLGVKGIGIDEATAEAEQLNPGVYVTSAAMDSPAMQAGIQPGDIIEQIDGVNIYTVSDLYEQILKKNEGELIRMVVKRRGTDGFTTLRMEAVLTSLK